MEVKSEKFSVKERRKPSKAYRRLVWMQIYLPLILAILIVGGLVTGLWLGKVSTFSAWADTSLVLLTIPVILVSLIVLAVCIAVCYGIMRLIGLIPEPAKRGQEFAARAAQVSRRVGNLIARPFLYPHAARSAMAEALRSLTSIFTKD
jgi:flagellar biogenesis protein FliO